MGIFRYALGRSIKVGTKHYSFDIKISPYCQKLIFTAYLLAKAKAIPQNAHW